LGLGACKGDQTPASHDEGEGHAHADEIVFPAAKAEAAGVKVSVVEAVPFRQVIRTSGQITAARGDEAVAVATVSGIVAFRVTLTEGTPVARGAALLALSSDNIAEGDPVRRARVDFETARKEYERMKALLPDKIVSEKEFAQAERSYENARISYEALAKNHSAGGQVVTAPIAGFVKNVLVKEGDYVTVGQPLVELAQNRTLYLRAEVSEKYYPYLRGIVSANFKTPYDDHVYELGGMDGKLLSYGKLASDGSRYVPVTFEFTGGGNLVPGSYVEVYLLSTPMEHVVALPHTALVEEQGTYFVYLRDDDEEDAYLKREVTLGADNGRSVQILKGVNIGDQVVTEGAYQVKLASATAAIPPHTHEH
jgi:RND family efflux transporter MFP subunit